MQTHEQIPTRQNKSMNDLKSNLAAVNTLDSQKELFLLEEGVTYLNCANMSPLLKTVKEAGLQALETRAAPWKISSEDWFTNAETLRILASQIFQTHQDNIALIPSVSYGIATAAKNLKIQPGKTIILLEQQFPSNYYAWENLANQFNLRIVKIQGRNTKTMSQAILESVDNNTGLIAIPNCHWIDGTFIDIESISDAAKAVGSYLVLDLSQSLGALPIDIDRIQPDFAVAVGYKWLLGPYGLGYMYVSKKWQEAGEPLEYSWLTKKGSGNFAALTDYVKEFRDGARKFDMGEFPQFNLLPMAIAALQQIIDWEVQSIQKELRKLTDRIIDYKRSMKSVDKAFLGVGHMTSIPLRNLNVNDLRKRLRRENVVVSFRGNLIRVSPHLNNGSEDIEKLLSCL